jgi:hypothetical protein
VISTELGNVEIDYLDVVLMQKARSTAYEQSLRSLFRIAWGARGNKAL